MKTSRILFAICLLGWVSALTGLGGGIVTGFTLAIGSVFFILAFITRLIEKVEATAA